MKKIACKNCSSQDLHWTKTPKGWRLFDDNGQVHLCAGKTNGTPQPQPTRAVSPASNKLAEIVSDLILKIDAMQQENEAKFAALTQEIDALRLQTQTTKVSKGKSKKSNDNNLTLGL